MENAEPGSPPRRPRIFYGWWVVALAALVMATVSMPSYNLDLWVSALEEEFDWSRISLSLAFTVSLVVSVLAAPIVGYLIDRHISIRRMVIAGLFILAGALFLFSQIQNFWMYLGAAAIVGVGAAMSG